MGMNIDGIDLDILWLELGLRVESDSEPYPLFVFRFEDEIIEVE